jgi:hypothetical protein
MALEVKLFSKASFAFIILLLDENVDILTVVDLHPIPLFIVVIYCDFQRKRWETRMTNF